MIRFFSTIVAILVVNGIVCNAQASQSASSTFPKAVFGIKAGMNISRFSASINSETRAKLGLALGFYLKKQIGPRLFFRPELYYSNQGQQDNYLYPYGGPSIGSTTTSMHYINVPCLLEIGKKVSLQLGMQLGILVMGTEKCTVKSVKVDDNLNDTMTKADLSAVVGVGYAPREHFNCGARINYGITNIYSPKNSNNRSSTIDLPTVENRVFHFYVAYSF